MKRTWTIVQIVARLAALGAVALGLVAAFRAWGGGGGAARAYPAPIMTDTPPAYPPPKATVPPPELTAMLATSVAQATTSAPAPSPTVSYPLTGPICYIDRLNQFDLSLPTGWYADPPPSPNALGGASVIYNYDPSKVVVVDGNFPPGSLKIQISSDKLAGDQSFEQWLSSWIDKETSSAVPVPLTATEPKPYTLGKYVGSSFVLMGYGPNIQEIALQLSDGRVLILGLMPAESSALSKGLSILTASLEVSPALFCS